MKVVWIAIRYLLALQFSYAGVEKLFLQFDRLKFMNANIAAKRFTTFYILLQETGYLNFVGFFQLLCGLLLIFHKTYLLGSVMLTPLILCLLATHVFISKNPGYIIYDSILFSLNALLIVKNYTELKSIFFTRHPSILKICNSKLIIFQKPTLTANRP